MNKHANNGQQCYTVDASQLAEILTDPSVNTLMTLDHGAMRAIVCSGQHEGDFIIFKCAMTGDAFITQPADSLGESVHAHARSVLTADY